MIAFCDIVDTLSRGHLNSHMPDEERNDHHNFVDKLIALLSELPWPEVVGDEWKTIREPIPSRSPKDMYVI